jgi:hypothetical protein
MRSFVEEYNFEECYYASNKDTSKKKGAKNQENLSNSGGENQNQVIKSGY